MPRSAAATSDSPPGWASNEEKRPGRQTPAGPPTDVGSSRSRRRTSGSSFQLPYLKLMIGSEEKQPGRRGRRAARFCAPGSEARGDNSDIDAGCDRLELADALTQIRDFDPSAGRGKAAVAERLGQLHLLELEPAVPSLKPGPARRTHSDENARGKHSNRDRVHHFSSWRSASISRASSSFCVLMW